MICAWRPEDCGGLKAFAGAAVLTLALGIAGTTVMSALIEGVLLRPLPVRDQGRLIVSWKEFPSARSRTGVSVERG